MPSTPDHDLPFPGPDDRPNAPKQIRALAEKIDAALTALVPDSGVRSDIDITAADNWSITAKSYRTIGKKLYLRLQVQRDGPTITADSSGSTPGNIPDTTVATINDAARRPVMQAFTEFRGPGTGGSAQVNPDGRVRIVDAHKGSSISDGDTVNIVVPYPIA